MTSRLSERVDAEYVRIPPDDASVLLDHIPWATYVLLRDTLEERGSHARLTYLEGALEIMRPSDVHEREKSDIGRLLEAWAEEADVDLWAYGSTTFRTESSSRGIEADESYNVGPLGDGEVPDLAIEVVRTSWQIDKLAVYAGLGVGEVWIFRDGGFDVRVLRDGEYERHDRSSLFPELDLSRLAHYVTAGGGPTARVRAWRRELRGDRS